MKTITALHMKKDHNIYTKRLVLRRVKLSDAAKLATLANDPEIAETTMRMPYPCHIEYIKDWLNKDIASGQKNSGFFVISIKESQVVIGVIGLEVHHEHENAELGYWIGKDYWNNGYCTEAAKAMLEHGFKTLQLNRIWTFYIEGNEASGKVLEKIGMKHEGTLKKHIKKNGVFKNLEYYGKNRKSRYLTHPT